MGKRRGRAINDAILLYEAPTGVAILSFDAGYLEKQAEDFWTCIPRLTLKMFMKYDRGSTFIDLVNNAIDDRLARRLTMWCGSKKKLIVGSAEYKRIIETKLGITCLNVDVPDDEVVFGLKNPVDTLLPEENSEPTKKDHHPMGEAVAMFLRQHGIDMKPEMVDKYVVEAVHLVHCIELREKEHLKFFRFLLKDFMVMLGLDTTKWSLIQFATVPKMICYPTASYEIRHPAEIFSDDEYLKIETNALIYKQTFSKIGPLSVYEDVISLRSAKYRTLRDLGFLVMKVEMVQENADVIRLSQDHSSGEPNRSDLRTTDSYQLEAPNSAESKQQEILNQSHIAEGDHCLAPDKVQVNLAANMDGDERNTQAGDTGVHSMDDYGEKLTASALDLLGNKDAPNDTSVKETKLHGNVGHDEKRKQSRGTEGIPDTGMSSKSERNKQKDVTLDTSEIPKSGPLNDLNGDGNKPTASALGPLRRLDEHTETGNPVADDKENEQARDTDAQSIGSGKKKLTLVLLGDKRNEEFNATSSRLNSVLNEQKNVIPATSSKQNEMFPATSSKQNEVVPSTSSEQNEVVLPTSSEQNEVVPPTSEITAADTPADVQSMGGDKRNRADSGQLKDLIDADTERGKKKLGPKDTKQ